MKDMIIVNTPEELDDESRMLIANAQDALPHAYAPYSNFRVAAAILLHDGTILTGTNQENAAYPDGMCAERVTLFALASQHPGKNIKKLVVIAQHRDSKTLSPATCCGSCRQVMLEFEQRQHKPFEVVMQHQDHTWIKAASAQSLLPFSFSKESMG